MIIVRIVLAIMFIASLGIVIQQGKELFKITKEHRDKEIM